MHADPFKYCAAPPVTLGFEVTAGPASNPLSFDSFTFLASNNRTVAGAPPSTNKIVDSDNEAFPAIASGDRALESTFTGLNDIGGPTSLLSLDIRGNATFSPFIAVSGYVNTLDTDEITGVDVNVVGTFNNVNQASCQSGISGPNGAFETNGTLTVPPSPVPVIFASATDTCIVDLLSFQTMNTFSSSSAGSGAALSVVLSLDDFVVCKPNLTALQGVLPP